MILVIGTLCITLATKSHEPFSNPAWEAGGDLVAFSDDLGKAAFVSHQWLAKDHPDPEFRQMSILQNALKHILSSSGSLSLDCITEGVVRTARPLPLQEFQVQKLYFWYDYFSCPQLEYQARASEETDYPQQANAINSIPAYISECHFFFALCPVLDCPLQGKVLTAASWRTPRGGGALLQPGAVARESTWYKFLPAGGTGGCSPLVPPSCLGPGR